MSAVGVRRFDLYDFFSVLLPGLALLLGLYPLFPRQLGVTSLGAVLPLLAGGFVGGRAVHAGAVRIEDQLDVDGHRELFVQEMRCPTLLNEETVDEFYALCREVFGDIGLGCQRTDLDDDKTALTLYTVVRSYVHIDSRGRSRTFQAVSAFYRSMWLVSVVLAVAYSSYGIIVPFSGSAIGSGVSVSEAIPYVTKIAALSIPPPWFGIGSLAVLAGSYTTFRNAKTTHRRLFVEYLIADFIALREDN